MLCSVSAVRNRHWKAIKQPFWMLILQARKWEVYCGEICSGSEFLHQAVLKSSGDGEERKGGDILYFMHGLQGAGWHCGQRYEEERWVCFCVWDRQKSGVFVCLHTFGLCVLSLAELAVRLWLKIWGNEQGKGEEQNLDINMDSRKKTGQAQSEEARAKKMLISTRCAQVRFKHLILLKSSR